MARPPAIETETGVWLALNIGAVGLTDDQFLQLCRENGDFHFEISAQKELIIEKPTVINGDPELPGFKFDFREMFLV